jgi:hypothetical protein
MRNILPYITDALLGAAALGDIGMLFPDTDPQWKGANSAVFLTEAVRRVRAAGYTIVKAPGPDVMRLRICITEAQGATVVMDTMSSIMPPSVALNLVKTLVTGQGLAVGEAGGEMEIKDSVTGERLAAAVDERAGRKYTLQMDKFSRYRTFEDAFEYWATRLQERLAEKRAPKPAPVKK